MLFRSISSNLLQVAQTTATSVSACNSVSFSDASFSTISTGVVSGHFMVTPSDGGTSKRIGKVTISLTISEDTTHQAHIQSTVSLRDYGNVGL